MAGKNVVSLSLREIAIGSGLPLSRIEQIAGQTSWNGITIDEAERFVAGCQFDPFSYRDRNRKSSYTRSCQRTKQTFRYLRTDPAWETELKPLIKRLQSRKLS